jgi:hypothetical protein
VGRDHHRHPLAGQLPDHVQDLRDQLGVEGARDLVEEEQVGPHRQGPDDRHPLLLPPGEAVGVLVPLVGQAEPLEEREGLRLRLPRVLPEDLLGGERHVPQDRHVREQVEGLEHDADPPPDPIHVDARRRDLLPVDEDPARVDRLQEVDAPQERGLPRARRPDQADHLVLADLEVDAPEHLERAEGLPHPLQAERDGVAAPARTAGPGASAPRGAHSAVPVCRWARSRATSQSTSRVMGIVIAT